MGKQNALGTDPVANGKTIAVRYITLRECMRARGKNYRTGMFAFSIMHVCFFVLTS